MRSWSEAGCAARYRKDAEDPRGPGDVSRPFGRRDWEREAKGLYEQVVADYADLKDVRGRLLGERAKGELNELRSLKVGDTVPEVEGEDAGRQARSSSATTAARWWC